MNYIFDLFGTLIECDNKEYYSLICSCFGISYQDYKERLRGFLDTRRFQSPKQALKEILDFLNVNMTLDKQEKFFYDLKKWGGKALLKDETLNLLKEMKKMSHKTAVVSNANTLVEEIIERSGVNSLVDTCVFSYRVGYMKPQKEIYELAKKFFNASYEEITMVGDSLVEDVLAPASIGMDSILLDPKNNHPEYRGRKIKSLRELI